MKNTIKQKRREYNLTQKDIALSVGVTQKHISNIENNFKKPSLNVARKIAHKLHSTVEKVFPNLPENINIAQHNIKTPEDA